MGGSKGECVGATEMPQHGVKRTKPRVLLIGPYDPHCGEYTFLAPPLGVWRLQGVLAATGVEVEVFDPNCCPGPPEEALARLLTEGEWHVIGSSTTGMTLRFDLALAHVARRLKPGAVLLAGGMEATFEPRRILELGPFDLVVLGEGERPLLELTERLVTGADWLGIRGTAWLDGSGELVRLPQEALTRDELAAAVAKTPYERMPFERYWRKLTTAYDVGSLPTKAQREAQLAEIRSVRLNTLNYCPMGCTFCSSTNFLHAAQDSVARIRRLDAGECLAMVERIVTVQPSVRTIIFQDDIFVFTNDDRILPLCAAIVEAKGDGRLPRDLQFISTNRIDAMTRERLTAMRDAGFRVLGFGVESFSLEVLTEFNKKQIHSHIEPMLSTALELGITPFLDLILTSPRCGLDDLATTVKQGYRWLLEGCEMGMYPYVIPFSGAAMAADPTLAEHTIFQEQRIEGTEISWRQPVKILPIEPLVRAAIEQIEVGFESWVARLGESAAHLPSRIRSLIWINAAAPILFADDAELRQGALEALLSRLPGLDESARERFRSLSECPAGPVRRAAVAAGP